MNVFNCEGPLVAEMAVAPKGALTSIVGGRLRPKIAVARKWSTTISREV